MPVVSAYEAQTINVTSFVRQAIVTGKNFVGAPDAGGQKRHLVDPDVVPLNTEVCWDVTLTVTNDEPVETWYQVVLTDKFSAEMTDPVVTLDDPPVVIKAMNPGKGKPKKKRNPAAIEITWWVDYNGDPLATGPYLPDDDGVAFDPDTGEIDDDDGNFKTPAPGSGGLAPGETAQLVVNVCTGLNPAEKQEYTSPGCYDFNSGLTVKWLVGDPPELHRMSYDGNPLTVYAIDEASFTPGDENYSPISTCIAPNP